MAKTLTTSKKDEWLLDFGVSHKDTERVYAFMAEVVEDVGSLTELAELAELEFGDLGDDPEQYYSEVAFLYESTISYESDKAKVIVEFDDDDDDDDDWEDWFDDEGEDE